MSKFKLCPQINKEIIPLRILLFIRYLAIATVSPFLILHQKDIGMSLFQISIINAVSPVASFVVSPIAGFFIDRSGKYKKIFAVLTICVVLSTFSLVFVPYSKAQSTIKNVNIKFVCNYEGGTITGPKTFLTSMEKNASFSINNCFTNCNETLSEVCFCENKQKQCYVVDLSANNTIHFDQTNFDIKNVSLLDMENTSILIQNFKNKDNTYSDVKCFHRKSDCHLKCDTHLKHINTTLLVQIPANPITFPVYLTLKLIDSISISAYFPITRSIVLQIASQFNSDYGKVIWTNLVAFIIISPISGYLLQYFNYYAVFGLYACFMLLTFILTFFLKFGKISKSKNLKKKVYSVINNRETLVFLFMQLIFGIHARILDTFLYLFLTEINATKSLIGWTVTVSLIPAMFALRFLNYFVDGLGHVNIIIIGFLYLGLRSIGYSFLRQPELALLFEMFECLSHQVPVITMYLYSEILSQKEARTTIIAITGAVRHGIGRILGPIIGGVIITNFGYRTCFMWVGLSSFFWGFVYLIFYYFWIEKKTLNIKLFIKRFKLIKNKSIIN